jgi:hypothetical protein
MGLTGVRLECDSELSRLETDASSSGPPFRGFLSLIAFGLFCVNMRISCELFCLAFGPILVAPRAVQISPLSSPNTRLVLLLTIRFDQVGSLADDAVHTYR